MRLCKLVLSSLIFLGSQVNIDVSFGYDYMFFFTCRACIEGYSEPSGLGGLQIEKENNGPYSPAK